MLVDLSKGREPARSRLPAMAAAGDELGICAVQLAEFYTGQPRGQQSDLDDFLHSLKLRCISRDAALRTGMYRHAYGRRGRTIATPAAPTAAVAWRMRATVLTGNVKDYPMPDVPVLPL